MLRAPAAGIARAGGRSFSAATDAWAGYTSGMKTAISVPDELFEEVERLARRLNRSRSRLFADAMREYIARHDPETVTAALDRVYAGSNGACDAFNSAAAARILERTDW